MNEKFYMILTNIGLAKFANAQVTETNVTFTQIAVGDSNGAYYNPTASMTALVHEVWRGNINAIYIDENNPNWVVCEGIIPTDVGGFMVREMGLFDDENNLLAVGKVPETYKPLLTNGSAKDLYLKAILEVSNANAVTLKIDPAVTVASRKYVDDKIQIVSTNLANVQQQLATHLDKNASLTQSGHVQLSNAIDSNSETMAATPNAIRLLRSALSQNGFGSAASIISNIDTNNLENGLYYLNQATNLPSGYNFGYVITVSISSTLKLQLFVNGLSANNLSTKLYKRTCYNGTWTVWVYMLDNTDIISGSGSPEGVVVAGIGTLYKNTAGGTNTTLYVKTSGGGNTGWVAK